METIDIEPVVTAVVQQAPKSLEISTPEEANLVAEYREQIRTCRKTIMEFFKPMKESINKAKDALMERIHSCEDPLIDLQDRCNRSLSAWAEAERARVEAEQRRLDEEARKEAAKQAKADGDKVTARQIEQGKIAVVSNLTVKSEKVAGVAMIERWDADLTDLMALVKAAASGKVPLNYVTWDERVVKGVVRSSKGAASIPGVTPRKVMGVSGR
jgi:hypothetical protein